MNDARIRQILEAVFSARDLGHEPAIAELCGGDVELMARVDRILAAESSLLGRRSESPTSLAASRQLPPTPRRIGAFTVLEPLGAGGMSRVYRARHEALGREVALKVLDQNVMASEAAYLRFQREATVTAALDHPNIVPVYDAGHEDGQAFLAMRLVRGLTLDRLQLPMAGDEVARLGEQIAGALQAAHDIGVVHRDVKPANIMVEKGVAFVVDFGLSSFTHSAGAITREDATPGTLLYLAPELVERRGSGLDPRVDVYGLGATLYEAIAGRPPFEGGTAIGILHQIVHKQPPRLALRGRDRDLETIVFRAMEKSPERRLQSAAELAQELRRYLDGVPIRSRRISWAERGWRLARRHPVRSVGLTTIALVVLALVTTLVVQSRREARVRRELVAAAGASLRAGDVVSARTAVQRLERDHGTSDEVTRLRGELDVAGRIEALLACLQGPEAQQDPTFLGALVRELRTSDSPLVGLPRADAALAIASRLLDVHPMKHQPFAPATHAALPRASVAMAAHLLGGDPAAALASADPAVSSALDHLFAALALRQARSGERTVELELRRAPAEGPDGIAIRYSLGIALEAQGKYEAAIDVLRELGEAPGYAALVACDRARLLAHSGQTKEARVHLEQALRLAAPHVAPLLAGSELDVWLELGELPTFWRRWEELRESHGHLAWYWLRAGYAAADSANPADWDRAAKFLEQGLSCSPDPARRAALLVRQLQLDWQRSPAILDLSPLDAEDPGNDAEIRRLREVVRRADALVAETATTHVDRGVASRAMLVAAQASRAVGDVVGGWQRLDRACREHGDAMSMARYAMQAGYRVAQLHIEGADGDAEQGPRLDVAAAMGVARAIEVQSRKGVVDQAVAYEARFGLALCALHVGDPEVCLPACLDLLDDERVDASIVRLLEETVRNGGLSPRADEVPALLSAGGAPRFGAACAALAQACRNRRMSAERGHEFVAKYRHHLAAASSLPPVVAAAVTAALDRLEHELRETGAGK